MSATLKLRRTITGIGAIELHRGTFDVVLDGDDTRSIEWHENIEIPLEPGRHTLRVRRGRYSSRVRTVDVRGGDLVSFRCHGANLWPIWLVSLAVPSRGLSLRHE